MSGADCFTTHVKIHPGKRPLVAGDDDNLVGKWWIRRGTKKDGGGGVGKMDELMHLLCVKSSTTCHINISAFTDAATGDDIEGKIWQ